MSEFGEKFDLALSRILAAMEPKKILENVGQKIHQRILVQTAQGKGPNGEAFKPYAYSYRLMREKAGRPTGWRDLYFSGRMMVSLQHQMIGFSESHLYFNRGEEGLKAHGHHFGSSKTRLPATGFMGVSEKEVNKMLMSVLKKIKDDAVMGLS